MQNCTKNPPNSEDAEGELRYSEAPLYIPAEWLHAAIRKT